MQLHLFTEAAPPDADDALDDDQEYGDALDALCEIEDSGVEHGPDWEAANVRIEKRRAQLVFEAMLRRRQLPYVAVDENKRAAFRGAKLQRFDFIVYSQAGPNWLVYVGQSRKRTVEGMRRWQETFGVGFQALFATLRADDFEYRALSGETLSQPFGE